MRARLAMVGVVVLLAAGCGSGGGGGGGGSNGDASSVVPTGALAFAAINTDFSSSQLTSAQAILDKFPIKDKALQSIRSQVAKAGIDLDALTSSVGPELDIAVITANGEQGAVGFTQPTDEQTFEAQLAKGSPPPVHEQIDGWTVFAQKQAFLDAVKNRSGNLADDPNFQAAMKTVPGEGDAIARAYVSTAGAQAALGQAAGTLGAAGSALGPAAQSKWIAAALTSQDAAFKLEVHAKARVSKSSSGSGLADKIPSGAIVALSLTGGVGALPASTTQQAAGLSKQVGFDVGALLDALHGPVIAYVRPGIPIPEVTIAAKPLRPVRAAKAVGQLIGKITKGAGKPVPTKVDGGTLLKVDLGSIAIYYGVASGYLVVSDSANAVAELNGSAGHLSDDSVFKEAKDGAGMPDSGQGFLYVDLKDAVPAVAGLAQLAGQKLPPSAQANLAPLRSLLVYGSRDGDLQSFVAYLKTS
jgi:hypothetical protein